MNKMRRLPALIGSLAVALVIAAPPPATVARAASVTTQTFPIERSGVTHTLQYCGNRSATEGSTLITRIVVVVHGDGRNACDYASYAVTAASAAGQSGNTLIIAPRFVTNTDIKSTTSNLYWSSSGWKSGDLSKTSPLARSWRMSSFEAVDTLLASATSGRFPNLRTVVVAGHSAGGQFVNRYAAGAKWRPTASIDERFVIANPSSYLYWDDQRFTGGQWRTLTTKQKAGCPGYNDYKYGLANRNTYMAEISTDALKTNYATSTIRYLLGGKDTDPKSSSLDTSCEAKLQGVQRLERGQRYYSRLPAVLGTSVTRTHALVVVPGVGHDGKAMFNSSAGVAALFESD